MNWEETVKNFNADYVALSKSLDHSIKTNPTQVFNYYYLGLAYLIQNQKEKAEKVWDLGLLNNPRSFDWHDLFEILEPEAKHQEQNKDYASALNIRLAIRKHFPNDFNNLVQIFYLSLHLDIVTSSTLQDLNLYEVTDSTFAGQKSSDKSLLFQLILNILSSRLQEDQKLEFVSFAQKYFSEKEKLFNHFVSFVFQLTFDSALKLLELILENCPNHLMAFTVYNNFLGDKGQYDKAIQLAQDFLVSNQNDIEVKTICNHLLLGIHLAIGSKWEDTQKFYQIHSSLVSQVIAQELKTQNQVFLCYLIVSGFFGVYFYDRPSSLRPLQSQVSSLFQKNIRAFEPRIFEQFQKQHALKRTEPRGQKIKIGFLSTTLREHSVGWLARFLIDNLDRNAFELYGYFPEYQPNQGFLQTWYISKMYRVFHPAKGLAYFHDVAQEIANDKIDILIDLESITSALCSQVLALKPAPLQITWLGFDASGISAIDYYVADRYVLPENAQDYYSEKIWRLPNAYIAIDGFEATVPKISRGSLEIPDDAIIYFSSQTNRKRHPDTVRLQMRILKEVPNSYFLIKGFKENDRVEQFFREISEEEGVKWEQLRFLRSANSEAEHRANLNIADVVLDTYPYNGATTTMEVLWMGVPLVTRVGEQYVARNSYTMMMNAGITEGIAWTSEEYVEWGVRFGTEPDLRRDVAWKLRQSRKTSPLWNSKQFTKDMEKALKEMWEIYNNG